MHFPGAAGTNPNARKALAGLAASQTSADVFQAGLQPDEDDNEDDGDVFKAASKVVSTSVHAPGICCFQQFDAFCMFGSALRPRTARFDAQPIEPLLRVLWDYFLHVSTLFETGILIVLLLGTSATLVVTGALLVVAKSY